MERHVHGSKDNIKITTLSKLICRLNVAPVGIPAGFFAEIEKLILKFTRKLKGPITAKTLLKKKVGGLPDFKTY